MNNIVGIKHRLSKNDCRAVDILLDQAVSGQVFRGPSHTLSATELAGATGVLELLSMMQAVDPPPGLGNRVMAAVDAPRHHEPVAPVAAVMHG